MVESFWSLMWFLTRFPGPHTPLIFLLSQSMLLFSLFWCMLCSPAFTIGSRGAQTLLLSVEVIKLRILRWKHYLGLSEWVLNVIACILIRERWREIWPTNKRGDFRWPWGADNGVIQPPEARRSKDRVTPEPLGAQPGWHLDFSPIKLMLGSWLPELWKNTFISF